MGHPDETKLRELVEAVSIPMPTEGAAAATGRNYRELLKADDLEWIAGHPEAQTISLVLTRATNHPLKHRRRNLGDDPPMYPSVFALLQFLPSLCPDRRVVTYLCPRPRFSLVLAAIFFAVFLA